MSLKMEQRNVRKSKLRITNEFRCVTPKELPNPDKLGS